MALAPAFRKGRANGGVFHLVNFKIQTAPVEAAEALQERIGFTTTYMS